MSETSNSAAAATVVAGAPASPATPTVPAPKPLHPSVWAAITAHITGAAHVIEDAVDVPGVKADVEATFAFLSSEKGIALLSEIGSILAMAAGPLEAQTWGSFAGVIEKLAAMLDDVPVATAATTEPAPK